MKLFRAHTSVFALQSDSASGRLPKELPIQSTTPSSEFGHPFLSLALALLVREKGLFLPFSCPNASQPILTIFLSSAFARAGYRLFDGACGMSGVNALPHL